MPFKIVETIEKRQKKLCIVPSSWEKNGQLRWPKKRIDITKYIRDENSKPFSDWYTLQCVVKRLSLPSYSQAENELDLMEQNSDTDMERTENTNCNFNALAEHLVFTRQEGIHSPVASTSRAPELPAEIPNTGFNDIEYIGNIEIESVQEGTYSCIGLPASVSLTNQENTKLKEISENIQTILSNQNSMAEVINVIVENQKKIFHKLASLSVQLNDQLINTNQNVTPLTRSSVYAEAFKIKPIESIVALEELESLLSDNTRKSTLLQQYQFVCSESNGRGVTCAYKVLDMFFARDFLCKCSWTGGSRNSDQIKVGLKGYKNVLNFLYELIYSWDKTFTLQDNENFFKIVLKNSLKRKLNKNVRASTKRTRTNKNAPGRKNAMENGTEQKGQKTNEEGSVDQNMAEKMDTNKTDSVEVIDQTRVEEEEDESLC